MAMTRQQMFNTAYHGLAAQGFEKSTRADRHCAYRGANNMRCALGYLIPDSVYNPQWDAMGINVHGLVARKITREICEENAMFLQEMQDAHDESTGPGDMEDRLASFAYRHGLTIPTLPVNPGATPSLKDRMMALHDDTMELLRS